MSNICGYYGTNNTRISYTSVTRDCVPWSDHGRGYASCLVHNYIADGLSFFSALKYEVEELKERVLFLEAELKRQEQR